MDKVNSFKTESDVINYFSKKIINDNVDSGISLNCDPTPSALQ